MDHHWISTRPTRLTETRVRNLASESIANHFPRAPFSARPKCLRSIIVTICEHPGDVHEICNGYYISGSLDWYSPILRSAVPLFLALTYTYTDISWTNGSCAQIEKEASAYVFDAARYNARACIFIYDRAAWYTTFNSVQRPRLLRRSNKNSSDPAILCAHVTRTIPREKTPTSDRRGLTNCDGRVV